MEKKNRQGVIKWAGMYAIGKEGQRAADFPEESQKVSGIGGTRSSESGGASRAVV